jgi:hypothetical protein
VYCINKNYRNISAYVVVLLICSLIFSESNASNFVFTEESIFIKNAALENKNLYTHYIKKLKEYANSYLEDDESEDDESFLEDLFAVSGHRIAHSNKWSILAYREYDHDKTRLDVSSYTKITIMLPNTMKKKNSIIIDSTNRKNIIYSSGISAFPKSARFGYADDGIIEYEHHNKYVTVKFDIGFNLHNSTGSHRVRPTRIRASGSFDFYKVGLSNLTPWLGCKGNHIYDESFPNDSVCVSD